MVKQNPQHARHALAPGRRMTKKVHRRVLKSFKFNCFVCTESRDIPYQQRWPYRCTAIASPLSTSTPTNTAEGSLCVCFIQRIVEALCPSSFSVTSLNDSVDGEGWAGLRCILDIRASSALCIVSISTETKNQLSISSDTNFKITSSNINYICHFLSLCFSFALRIHSPVRPSAFHIHPMHPMSVVTHKTLLSSSSVRLALFTIFPSTVHRHTMHSNRISKFTLTYFVN